jgi:hypothetical protein
VNGLSVICAPGYALIAGRCVPHTDPPAAFSWTFAVWVVVVAVVLIVLLGVLVWRWR